MAIWQIGCGSDRCYSDVFLEEKVALIGPGDPGEWNPQRSDTEYEGKSYVRRFASEVQKGDIFVLRKGQTQVIALGLVVSDYEYHERFEDVKAYDLQHTRRVLWHELKHIFKKPVFGKIPRRLSQINDEDVLSFVEQHQDNLYQLKEQLPNISLDNERLGDNVLENQFPLLCGAIKNINILYRMYKDPKNEMCPLEKETQTHLVIPFLTALGWKPEQIAIERQKVDITLFDSIYRSDDTCRFMIEVKTLGAGVEEDAFEQVQGYACSLNKKCDIVVTDGIRYRLYTAASNFCQNYYANLSRLKKDSIELFRRLERTQ